MQAVQPILFVAAVRAQLVLVAKESRLFEFAHQLAQLKHGIHQAGADGDISGQCRRHVKVTLRRLVLAEGRLLAQVQHEVEVSLPAISGSTVEV